VVVSSRCFVPDAEVSCLQATYRINNPNGVQLSSVPGSWAWLSINEGSSLPVVIVRTFARARAFDLLGAIRATGPAGLADSRFTASSPLLSDIVRLVSTFFPPLLAVGRLLSIVGLVMRVVPWAQWCRLVKRLPLVV
jgi:hypothetical protein